MQRSHAHTLSNVTCLFSSAAVQRALFLPNTSDKKGHTYTRWPPLTARRHLPPWHCLSQCLRRRHQRSSQTATSEHMPTSFAPSSPHTRASRTMHAHTVRTAWRAPPTQYAILLVCNDDSNDADETSARFLHVPCPRMFHDLSSPLQVRQRKHICRHAKHRNVRAPHLHGLSRHV